MIYYFIYHDIMSEKMIHKREFRIACNQMSIELLKSLDAFLNKNILPANIENSSAHLDCNNFELNGKILSEILENENFITDFNNDFSIYLRVSNTEPYNVFWINILKKEDIRIFGSIENTKEDIVIGKKELIERFIKENFVKNEQTIQQSEEQSQVQTITLIKKDLSWNVPAIKLSSRDFADIENLMLQDLYNIQEYKIIAIPSTNYVKKQQNANSYKFKSVTELLSCNDLLQNIKNYSIQFSIIADDINLTLSLTNDNWARNLKASGKNQTLYYGKYILLKEYLNTKKNWYYGIYNEYFKIFLITILSLFVSYSALKMGYYFAGKKYSLVLIYVLLNLMLFIGIFLTPMALPKNNFYFDTTSPNRLPKFIQGLWGVIVTIVIGLFINLLTPACQNFLSKIFK